jgi:carbamoylphosphate synthase large subunit
MHYFQNHFGKIDRIDSQSEYWLGHEAGLRSDFQVWGLTRDGIERVKRKSLMKQTFIDAGLNPARGRICHEPEEVRAFIKEVGYPVVAKPDIGVGAAVTYKLENDDDVARYLDEKPYMDYILEEFIGAPVVTFDGLTDAQGEPIFLSQMVYSQGVMDVVNYDTDIYYYTCRKIDPALEKAGRATLKAFDVRERFFHFEFFLMPDGSVRPMEVNMRPPGGYTMDMLNVTFDFDAYKIWAELMVQGKTPRFTERDRKYFVNYVGRKDYIKYAMNRDQVYEKFGHLIVMEQRMPDAFSRALGNSFFLVRHEELQPVIDAANAIMARG